MPKAFDGASVLPKLRVRHLREGFPRAERRLMALRYFSSFVSVVCKMDFHVPKDVWPVLRFVLSKLRVYRLRDGVLRAEGRMAEIHFRSVRAERGL